MSSYIITGANGDIAISMADILRQSCPDVRLIGTDIESKWPALGASFDDVEIIPKVADEGYISTLESLIKKYSPEYIIPTSEPELRWIARNHKKCSHIPFLMNLPDLILTCMDKLESMRWLTSIGIDVPETKMLSAANIQDIPFIMKPRFGAGSRGIKVVRNAEDFEKILA